MRGARGERVYDADADDRERTMEAVFAGANAREWARTGERNMQWYYARS